MQIEVNQHNMIADLINLNAEEFEFISGIPGTPRMRRIAPVTQINPTNQNSFTVNAQQVGVINTGYIGRIDHAIQVTKTSTDPTISDQLELMKRLIVTDAQQSTETKNELLEMLAFAMDQVTGNSPKQTAVLSSILTTLSASLQAIPAAFAIWDKIKSLFG